MTSEEALNGMRVRVSESLLRADLRGKEGTITGRWGHPEYVAQDVLLGDGRLELFWHHELDEVTQEDAEKVLAQLFVGPSNEFSKEKVANSNEDAQMDEPRTNGATLLDAQPRFAEMSLDAYVDANAQGAKIYWAMWGPIGQPAIDAQEVLERTQHRYLEQLRDAVQARIEARSRSSGRSTGGVGTPLFTQA